MLSELLEADMFMPDSMTLRKDFFCFECLYFKIFSHTRMHNIMFTTWFLEFINFVKSVDQLQLNRCNSL